MKRLIGIAVAACACLSGSVALAAPVEYVRVCGTGSYYDPGTDKCVDATAGVKAEEGVALSLATPGATIGAGKTFGASVHIGTFEGQSALGVGGAVKANDDITVDGAFGVGLGQGTMGGRAGVNVSW